MAFERRRVLAATLLVGCVSFLSTKAFAQSASDRETARSLMEDGDAKADRGDWKAALKAYEQADQIMHVPSTGYELAYAQANLGLLIEARDTLARVARIPLPAKGSEPAPFTAARRKAETLSNDLAKRIPSITLQLQNVDASQPPQILVDGESLSYAAAQVPRKVNPGPHRIVVRQASVERSANVVVAEHDSRTVTLDLAGATTMPPPPVEDTKSSSSSSSSTSRILVYGGFGLAIVGAGVGGVTGVMSFLKTKDLKDQCDGNQCPPSKQNELDSTKTLGNISTVAFIAGGVGLAAGIIGLVIAPNKEKSEASTTTKPHASRSDSVDKPRVTRITRITPLVSPTWMGLSGTF
ncbi:hypothetical protein AKJ09_07969 [Labilithrix luteola]|uniref:PEGA domain-containing protein n=1 Tax=Labilithrix luteola TaxID=1391654 RepID=A0A0K1Q656_9BACT|nr:hypothetical protein [Labilithrix luteola]AKV01306.1 hypothetical protein AKJ09_07969 [Labilithrix luteola]